MEKEQDDLIYMHVDRAGNEGDVWKHAALCLILTSIQKAWATKRFTYVETHAGSGMYPLLEPNRSRWASGVGSYLQQKTQELSPIYSKEIKYWFEQVPKKYPGSAYLAHTILTPETRQILIENNSSVSEILKRTLPKAEVINKDCWEWMELYAMEENLVWFVDPPYINSWDWKGIVQHISRIPSQSQCIFWYPLGDRFPVEEFTRDIMDLKSPVILIEQHTNGSESSSWRGSGIGIANLKDEELLNKLTLLAQSLGDYVKRITNI